MIGVYLTVEPDHRPVTLMLSTFMIRLDVFTPAGSETTQVITGFVTAVAELGAGCGFV